MKRDTSRSAIRRLIAVDEFGFPFRGFDHPVQKRDQESVSQSCQQFLPPWLSFQTRLWPNVMVTRQFGKLFLKRVLSSATDLPCLRGVFGPGPTVRIALPVVVKELRW